MEKIGYVLESSIPTLLKGVTQEERETHDKWMEHDNHAKCYMLASMSRELQKALEKMPDCRSMLLHL